MKFLIVLSKENVNGERTKVTSYLLGVHKKNMKELLELAKEEYPDCYYIEDDGTIFDALAQDKAYKDGKVVDLTPIPPTASEIKVHSVEEIKNKYNVLNEALKDKILTATLTGNQVVIEKLQNEYKQNVLNMTKELKAVKG